MTGVPSDFVTARDFIQVRPPLVKHLGGANEALVWSRIHYRLNPEYRFAEEGPDGFLWWKVSYAELGEETGLNRDQVKRAVIKMVEAGDLLSRQEASSDRTSSYRTVLADETQETPHRAESPDGDDAHGAESPYGLESDGAESPDGGSIGRNRPVDGAESPDAPPIKKDEEDISLFEQFWAAYPRKVDKGHAHRRWSQARGSGASPSAIIAGAQRYAASTEVVGKVGKEAEFIKKPGNWLNDECWLNDYTPAVEKGIESIPSWQDVVLNPDDYKEGPRRGR